MRQMMRWLLVGVVAVMMTACGGGGGGELTAIQKIATYAQSGGTPPSVQMYADAGVTGVTEDNLDEINAVVAGLNYEDVDTPAEVQGYVNQLGVDIVKPIFSSSATASVTENQTSAITLVATDTTTVTYSISGGDSASFAVDASSGVVTFTTAPDYETQTSYSFTATATDSTGNSATQTVTIIITDIDEIAPVFTSLATASVAENQTSAITLVATDENPITYSISGGESAEFNIDATTGVVTFKTAPDFETQDSYGFAATATDTLGNSATQAVTITITDVPEGQAPKKTGQTQSYDENGTVVTDNSIKDDGFYQKGIDPSYSRDDTTQIVTDHITGLQWQDDADANSTKKQWLTDTNYNTCDNNHSAPECYDTSGDTAATYCSKLTLGGYSDWRLPTSKELMGIADRSKRKPAIDTSYFQHVVSNRYWSSTTVVSYEDGAWVVDFYFGDDRWGDKSYSHYVRCVRDGQ